MSSSLAQAAGSRVTAVIVAHDGEPWIPQLLSGLEASTRLPDHLVAVDTGSTDSTPELLRAALGANSTVFASRSTGFGDAVRLGLDDLDRRGNGGVGSTGTEWIWLLHDDCRPAPDALERLLATADDAEPVDVVGCRLRAWPRGQRLIEVGVTITGTGHRETGLELGETDQGQHNEQRTVLAVSTAGMLIRRSMWDHLGGLDPQLPLFRDDVDFGWRVARAGGRVVICPEAVLFHAEAATRSARAISSTQSSPHRADRRAALYTVLANCSAWALPWQSIRLVLGTVLRAVGYLLARLPGAALDELAALGAVLARPGALRAARVVRKQTSQVPQSAVRRLLPPWWTPYFNGAEALMSRFGSSARDRPPPAVGATGRRSRPAQGFVRTLIGVGLLCVVALVAGRGLWFGDGLLRGGALLPAPGGARDWWQLYLQTWHPTGMGSDQPTSPYVAVLALLGGVGFGKAWLVVDVVMLLAVPLAAVGAYVLAGKLVRSPGVRVWTALAYGMLPVLTGAVTSGHLGTVVAAILLPWLVRAILPLADVTSRRLDWQPVYAGALVLSVMVAFCPLSWPMAATVGVLALPWMMLRLRGHHGSTLTTAVARVVVLAVSPVVLLLPWSLELVSHPGRLLHEAGLVTALQAPDRDSAWQVVFGRLGVSGDAPWWISAGIVIAALAALARADRRAGVATAWVVVAVGVVTAALVARETVTTAAGTSAYPWLGFAVVVSQGAAIAAVGLAADGLQDRLRAGFSGWWKPIGVAVAALAVLTPVAGLAWWVVAAPHGDLDRAVDDTLPAYLVDTLTDDSQQRALVLRGGAEQVTYALWMDDGRTLGDDSVEDRSGTPELDERVAGLLSEAGAVSAAGLADEGIGYVALVTPVSPALQARLDSLSGLTRVSSDVTQSVLWQVGGAVGLVRLMPSPPSDDGAQVVGSRGGHVDVLLPSGTADRLVALAVPRDSDFRGTLDGVVLAPTVEPGAAGFTVGSAGGRLEIEPGGHRGRWLFAQLVIVVVTLVLAAPSLERPASATEEET